MRLSLRVITIGFLIFIFVPVYLQAFHVELIKPECKEPGKSGMMVDTTLEDDVCLEAESDQNSSGTTSEFKDARNAAYCDGAREADQEREAAKTKAALCKSSRDDWGAEIIRLSQAIEDCKADNCDGAELTDLRDQLAYAQSEYDRYHDCYVEQNNIASDAFWIKIALCDAIHNSSNPDDALKCEVCP